MLCSSARHREARIASSSTDVAKDWRLRPLHTPRVAWNAGQSEAVSRASGLRQSLAFPPALILLCCISKPPFRLANLIFRFELSQQPPDTAVSSED